MKQLIKMRSLFLALSLSISAPCLAQDIFRIVYLPFTIEAYAPVTEKTIEQSAFINILVRHQKLPDSIRSMVKPEQTLKLDPKAIRLLMVDGKSRFLFDRDGNGIQDGVKAVSISTKDFDALISQNGINLSLSPFPKVP